MLHKSILQVALKCFWTNTTGCLGQFLALDAKVWCIILEILSQDLLSLMESSIVDDKKIHGAAPDIAKAATVNLDETTKLCRAYSEAAKVDNCTLSITNEDATVEHNKQGFRQIAQHTKVISSEGNGSLTLFIGVHAVAGPLNNMVSLPNRAEKCRVVGTKCGPQVCCQYD